MLGVSHVVPGASVCAGGLGKLPLGALMLPIVSLPAFPPLLPLISLPSPWPRFILCTASEVIFWNPLQAQACPSQPSRGSSLPSR